MQRTVSIAIVISLVWVASAQAGMNYNVEYLYAEAYAGGFLLPDNTLTFGEHRFQGYLGTGLHQAALTSNTLTSRGGSSLNAQIFPTWETPQYIEATLDNLQAELTDTNYSSVFSQGHSYFQFWLMPRDKDYEYDVKVTQEWDEGLVPAYMSDGNRPFDLFTVLQGVGGTGEERGEWRFNGVLAAGTNYQWYGGVHAAAESSGPLSGPFNARVRVDFTLLPEPDDRVWIGPDGGLFSTAANWNPNSAPTYSNARAIFNSPSASDLTVGFNSGPSSARLLVTAPAGQTSSNQVILDLNSNYYSLVRDWNEVNRASVTIADTAGTTARLAIIDGAVVAQDVEIALAGTGELTVGQGGVLRADQHFISVGTQGVGSMNVVNGGLVDHGHGFAGQYPGSQGTITVDGTMPSNPAVRSRWYVGGWFGLGDQGQGSLNVSNGAEVRIGKCDMACNPGSQGTAGISGNNSRWELAAPSEVSLIVGKAGTASVHTSSGGSIVNQGEMHLAENPGTTGSLILDGPGRNDFGDPISAMLCNQRLTVGYGGVGDFQVLANAWSTVYGALVVGTDPGAAEGVHSQVSVDGVDSSLEVLGRDGDSHVGVEIGRQGAGNSLSITNGAQAISEYIATIGGAPGSGGSLLVDGLDSLLLARYQLEVGRDSPGEAMVSNGSFVFVEGSNGDPEIQDSSKGLALIGLHSTGSVTVTGVNGETPSRLQSNAQLVVGVNANGNGTLDIDQGAMVQSWKHLSASGTAGIIGRDATSTGLVKIRNSSRWEMPDGGLTVGWTGNGSLEMTGGFIYSTYGMIGRTPGSQGGVAISGMNGTDPSHWDIEGSLAIGGDLSGNTGGTARLSIGQDCWVWASGSTTIYAPGTLSLSQGRLDTADVTLSGTIEGSGAVIGRVTSTGGVIHPTALEEGASRELYFERGCEQQSGGTFLVDVAGDGDYSAIRTYDGAYGDSLAGTLRVRILSNYIPPLGSTFDIAYAEGGITAAFDVIDLPTIQGEPVFELYMENPNTLRMRTIKVYSAPADFDQDGDVDYADEGPFEGCVTGPRIPFVDENCAWADLDRDDDIDQADFGLFQRCYSGEGVMANPECAN